MWHVGALSEALGVELWVGCQGLIARSSGAVSGRGEGAHVFLWICQDKEHGSLLFLGLRPMPACEYRRWPVITSQRTVGLALSENLALPLLSCITRISVSPAVKQMVSLETHEVLCAASGTQGARGTAMPTVIDFIKSLDTNVLEVDI